MAVIKSIDIMSWAKIEALFGIVFGLVYGVLFAMMGTVIGFNKGMPGLEAFGFMTIIIFPIVFAIMGFICGAIMAFFYNLFAGKIGGVRIELE
jgi:hypothetical protein